MGRGRKKKTSIDYESDQYNFIQELHNDGIDNRHNQECKMS